MKRTKLILAILLLTLIATSIGMFLKGGKVSRDSEPIDDALPESADMQLTGVHFTELTSAGRKWTMRATTMHYYKKRDMMVLDDPFGTFYHVNGPMYLSGDKCYYEKTEQKVRLVGRVKAQDYSGRVLTTEEVRYNLATGVMYAPGYFEIKGPRMDLTGYGLALDTKTRLTTVENKATVVLKQGVQSL